MSDSKTPEHMAVEMLLGDVLVWAAGRTTPALDQRAFDAARKALREAAAGAKAEGYGPAERMVAVMLTESDRQHWASYYVPANPQGTAGARLFDAARKAVAQQEVCGVNLCKGLGWHVEGSDICMPSDEKGRCALPKGHAGAHAP